MLDGPVGVAEALELSGRSLIAETDVTRSIEVAEEFGRFGGRPTHRPTEHALAKAVSDGSSVSRGV